MLQKEAAVDRYLEDAENESRGFYYASDQEIEVQKTNASDKDNNEDQQRALNRVPK